MTELTGSCCCGDVRITATGKHKWVANCHCQSCRRVTASPFTTFVGYMADQVVFGGSGPSYFESSPGVRRGFCDRCGTPLSFEGDRWPGEVHLFACNMETAGSLKPQANAFPEEKLTWIHLDDKGVATQTKPPSEA